MTDDAIEMRIDPRERPVGAGIVRRLLPYRARRMVGPFIFADIMGRDEMGPGSTVAIDAHPHIGLSTVTYLLEGRMVHRDSTGAVQTIEPGAVNWMTAGAGVTHTERSHPDDVERTALLHGLQTWVALPDVLETGTPTFQHTPSADIPADRAGASQIRVAVGSGWGLHSPVQGSSPLVLAEVRLADGATVPVPDDHPERAVIAIDGDVTIDGHALDAGQLAVLRRSAQVTLGGTGTAMVIGGEPLGKRHIWWNFVSSDPDRIEQAKADWSAQRFPTVPGDHDPYTPLPS